jgi:hypothetical protein
MYSFLNKHYIFKQFLGNTWNFFHDEKLGICYRSLTRKNTWTDAVTLEKRACRYFYATMYGNYFHIVFQDLHGNIVYLKYNGVSHSTLPILNSKSPSTYNKHLQLVSENGNIHFLYILLHNNNVLLSHQALSNGTVENPKVIDYIYGNNLPYMSVRDKSGNIYVFYQSANIASTQLGYRFFSRENRNWSAFTPITEPGTKCDFPSVVVDNSNIMHICFQKQGTRHYELIYKQKIPGGNTWSDETIVHSSLYPFDNSSVLAIDEKVIVYWVRNNTIYYCYSNNRGNSWGKPAKYNFPTVQKLTCVSYNTNIPYESGRTAIRDIPGSIANGLKLAFYQDFFSNNTDSSSDNLKALVMDYLKYFKESIDTLNNEYQMLKTRISETESVHNDLMRGKEKLSIKLNLLENELKQVKRCKSNICGIDNPQRKKIKIKRKKYRPAKKFKKK